MNPLDNITAISAVVILALNKFSGCNGLPWIKIILGKTLNESCNSCGKEGDNITIHLRDFSGK